MGDKDREGKRGIIGRDKKKNPVARPRRATTIGRRNISGARSPGVTSRAFPQENNGSLVAGVEKKVSRLEGERESERTSKLEEALQGQTIGPRVTTRDERVRAANKATVSHPVCLFACLLLCLCSR